MHPAEGASDPEPTLLLAQHRPGAPQRRFSLGCDGPDGGSRAGYSGHKRRTGSKGSKVHAAVDPLGYPLALSVTPASEDERTQVEAFKWRR
jgi:hypothetical protein